MSINIKDQINNNILTISTILEKIQSNIQFKASDDEDVDKWYNDMRIIWWNISHG